MINKLVTDANELLKNGGFEYAFCGGQALDLFLGYESRVHGDIDVCAFWDDRNRIIQYMQSQGFTVYEMLGGGRAHHITDVSDQFQKKKNIFCFRDGCPLVKTYPPDEDGCCRMEFFHIGQTEPDFMEFLFNDRSREAFEYARNREITREMKKAVLFREGVPYLAPELCLLYKSTDTEREGYQHDFELAYPSMDPSQREWFRRALLQEYPKGHSWLNVLKTEQLILRFADEGDLTEVARTWPSDHSPLSEEEARTILCGMRRNYARNTRGRIYHLCLAVCGKENPRTIMGWCGLDGSRNPAEPEIFIILDEAYRHMGYGTQCVRVLLRTAAEDYGLHSVHGGCDKGNTASKRAMEKGGMVQYGTEDNGDPLFRFTVKEKEQAMQKKLILISGSPCVGKTAAGTRLFESYDNSAYLDGDWCWCVHPFSTADRRLRNGDRSMSFVLSNYLDSDFEYVFFTSVVLTDPEIRQGILSGITAEEYETISFTLTCSEETLKKRHDRRGDEGETHYYWLHLPPCPGDIVIDTDNKNVRDVVREMKQHIDARI